MTRTSRVVPLLGLAVVLLTGQAGAQSPATGFPSRPIKIISASPAGGGVDLTTFFSLMAPPKTPPNIRVKLNKAIVAAMQTPEVQAKLKTIFVDASNLDTTQMGEFVKAEAKLWGDVIRAAHITVEQ